MNNEIKLYTGGMYCKSCSKTTGEQTSNIEFISQIKIDPKSGEAEFEIIGPRVLLHNHLKKDIQ